MPRRRTARCSLRPGTGARAFSLRTSDDAGGMRNDQFVWDFEAARFRADFNLLGRAQRLHENVVTGEPQLDEGHRGGGLVMPVAHGAAGRKRVAGHNVAGVQGLLGLIAQRRAEVLDRVEEVQAGGEQLQGSRRPRASAW